ncbi:Gfo/Idh/MocA family protein [Aestuariimicrobium kwangyangense]|uniref:Gfo/Idh/MocA family protein n=1 Tax=Aestuariimicrobium kwangyangense TaxID=396389 RepID=UPI0003B5CDDB|nr:Gfo/Idh/MocA family oxidoreductase [Aestuariimicrobium kwangyangense]
MPISLTSLLSPGPEFTQPPEEPSLRWGLLGPGWIADIFTRAMRHTPQRMVAVGSRSLERAEVFAKDHGIERAHGSYEQLLADPDVDVVYIATPQSEHLQQGLAAIAAGKHVIIEKPFTCTPDDARTLVEAARAAGVFVTEAMWSRYLPQTDICRRLVSEGVLGDLHSVVADHGQLIPHTPGHRLFRPELGGGALLDLGIYPAQLASMLFGAPTSVTAVGAVDSGVDTSATVALTHAGTDAPSTLTTSITAVSSNRATVVGTEARVELDGRFYNPTTLKVLSREGEAWGEYTDTTGRPGMEGLSWQQSAYARMISEGRTESPLHPHDEIVSIIATLDEARRQVLASAAASR